MKIKEQVSSDEKRNERNYLYGISFKHHFHKIKDIGGAPVFNLKKPYDRQAGAGNSPGKVSSEVDLFPPLEKDHRNDNINKKGDDQQERGFFI